MIAIGLGGNVGAPEAIVARFVRVRNELSAVHASRLYRSAAIGPEQPDYLNAAFLVPDNNVEPLTMLAKLHELEASCGRDRAHELRWGPRPLDLDVLVWEGRAITLVGLVVPHPRLVARRFALLPLADLLGEPWRTLANGPDLRDQLVELVASSW